MFALYDSSCGNYCVYQNSWKDFSWKLLKINCAMKGTVTENEDYCLRSIIFSFWQMSRSIVRLAVDATADSISSSIFAYFHRDRLRCLRF